MYNGILLGRDYDGYNSTSVARGVYDMVLMNKSSLSNLKDNERRLSSSHGTVIE